MAQFVSDITQKERWGWVRREGERKTRRTTRRTERMGEKERRAMLRIRHDARGSTQSTNNVQPFFLITSYALATTCAWMESNFSGSPGNLSERVVMTKKHGTETPQLRPPRLQATGDEREETRERRRERGDETEETREKLTLLSVECVEDAHSPH
jgi:hypothetical protein